MVPEPWCGAGGGLGGGGGGCVSFLPCLLPTLRDPDPKPGLWIWEVTGGFPLLSPIPGSSVQQLAGVGKLYSNNRDIPISPPGEGVDVPGIFNLFAIWPIYEVIAQVILSLSPYFWVYKILGLVL